MQKHELHKDNIKSFQKKTLFKKSIVEHTSWECDIVNCFIKDVTEEWGGAYHGPWNDDLVLHIELKDKEIPVKQLSHCCKLDIDGEKLEPTHPEVNAPLICISSNNTYYGLWKLLSAYDNVFECVIPEYDGLFWKPNSYAVEYKPGSSSNICVTPPPMHWNPTSHLGPLMDPSSNGTTSSNNKEEEDSNISKVFIAPPLRFHIRASVHSIDDIQTADQTFRTCIYIELRLREISKSHNHKYVNQLVKDYGFSSDVFELMNVIEQTSEVERWSTSVVNFYNHNLYDYAYKYKYHTVLGTEYHLKEFPFDVQNLIITSTLNFPDSRARIVRNEEWPSLFFANSFRFTSVFDVTYGEQVCLISLIYT